MVVLASKLLKRHEGGRELREIYDIWAKMIG